MAWAKGWLEMVLREGGVSCAARMVLPSMKPYARLLDRALALWRVSSLKRLLPGRGVLQTLPDESCSGIARFSQAFWRL